MMTALNASKGTTLADDLRCADGYFSRLIGLLMTPGYLFKPGSGLWIVPSRGVHTLGMRYAIDALYLEAQEDAGGGAALRVIHIEREMPPWRCGAVRKQARGVMELPAGTVARTGTQVGDAIKIN